MWKCLNSQCPDRKPVPSQVVCYTCGETMLGKVMNHKPLWAPEPGKMAETSPSKADSSGVTEAKYRILSEEEVKARDAGYSSPAYVKAVAGWTRAGVVKQNFTESWVAYMVASRGGRFDTVQVEPAQGIIHVLTTFPAGQPPVDANELREVLQENAPAGMWIELVVNYV